MLAAVMFLFVPREMGMGLVLEEGLRLVVEGEEPDSRRSVECPFTVEPGAGGLPAGALLDMGLTLARLGLHNSLESRYVCRKGPPLVTQ